jgi:hypothetical protein
MASWSITPNDTASIDASGKATFQANTSNTPREYTVTYTSDNGTVCTMTVTQQGNVCSFTYAVNTAKIPLTGKTGYMFGTLSNADGIDINIVVTAGSEFIDGSLLRNGNNIVGNVKSNDSSAETIPERVIKYKLKAGDVDCGGGDYTNTQEGKTCTCECAALSVNPTSLEWRYDETSGKTVTITPGCTTNITVDDTSSTDWFSVSYNDTSKVITVTPHGTNTELTAKEGSMTVKFKACGNDCTAQFKTIPFTQASQGCTCENITVGSNPSAWEWDEFGSEHSKEVAINDPNNCISNITVSQPSHFAASINSSRSKVTIYPTGINDTLGTISNTVTLSYTAGTYSDCTKSIQVSQKTSECDCDDVPVYFPNTVVGLGKGKYQIGMVLGDQDCESGLTMYSSSDQVLGWEINDENDVFVKLKAITEAAVITFGYKVDGKDCGERYLLRRICPCPIDNCWTEGVYEHPMHIDYAYKNFPGTTDRASSPHTGDSILIPVNRLVYNGTIIRGATIEYNPYPQITGGYEVHNTGLAVGDVIQNAGGYSWVTIIIRAHETGCITIDYYATENTSDEYRDADIYFDVDLNNGETKINEACLCEGKTGQEKQDCLDNLDWRNGLVPCESFKVILRQAPNGYKYRRTCIDQYTGNSKYVLYKWDVHVDDCSTEEGSTNPCGKDCS